MVYTENYKPTHALAGDSLRFIIFAYSDFKPLKDTHPPMDRVRDQLPFDSEGGHS